MKFLDQYVTEFEKGQLLKIETSYVGILKYTDFLERILRKSWKDGFDSAKRDIWHKKLPVKTTNVLLYLQDGTYKTDRFILQKGFENTDKSIVKYWKEIEEPDISIMGNKYNDC